MMNRLQSHENASNSPKFYVNSPAINRKFVKIASHFHGISLRFPNYQTRSKQSQGDLQVISFDGKGVPVIRRQLSELKARLGSVVLVDILEGRVVSMTDKWCRGNITSSIRLY